MHALRLSWRARLGLLAAAAFVAVASAQPVATPRYHFVRGAHAVYERREQIEPLDGGQRLARGVQQFQTWVISVADGRATMLGEWTDVADDRGVCRGGLVWTIDELGHVEVPPEFARALPTLEGLLEPWPELRDAFGVSDTWLTTSDWLGRRLVCRQVNKTDQPNTLEVVFSVREAAGLDALLGVDTHGAYTFDTAAHLVSQFERNYEFGQTRRRLRVIGRLFRQDHLPDDRIAQIAAEAEKYARTARIESRYRQQLLSHPRDADRLLKRVAQLWGELAIQLRRASDTPLPRLVTARRLQIERSLATWQARARVADRWLGRQAADWSLPDTAGRVHHSGEYVGRPVVEMFWSRESALAVRMLGRLASLRRQHAANELGILCVNVDGDRAAALQAVRACGPGVVQLLSSSPFVGDLAVPLPVFRVRDASGTVVGVAFDVAENLETLISQAAPRPNAKDEP